jgi:hypothetical protein
VDSLGAVPEPLAGLLRAIRRGVDGDPRAAIATADSFRQAINVTTPPDPFASSALHLLEGDWEAQRGRRAAADSAWRWYLAAEFEGWPTGQPQAGEVDGVLGVLARRKRAGLRLVTAASGADTAAACRMMSRVTELWLHADRSLAWVAGPPWKTEPCRH